MTIRVLGLTQGSLQDPLASSGLNASVFGALARQVTLVDTLDISHHGWQRYWNAITHWRPGRDRWREYRDENMWSFLELSRKAGRLIDRQRGDFDLVFQLKTIFAPGFPPGPWPYFIMIDNTYALSDRYYKPWAPMVGNEKKRWLATEKATYHSAEAVFARTPWVRRSLIDDYGLPPDKAVLIGTGANFQPSSFPAEKTPDDGRTILFVGKEMERKGVPTLLEAFALVRQRVPDARLVLVGRDANIRQEGVTVLGKITDRDRLRIIYEQASLFVLPANFEPNGLVIMEAMGYRLPCIVSDAGGLADQVTDGETGYVIPPRQPQILAERILDLLGSEEKRRRMGDAAARRVQETYNWDRVAARMLPHFQAALEKAAAGRLRESGHA